MHPQNIFATEFMLHLNCIMYFNFFVPYENITDKKKSKWDIFVAIFTENSLGIT